MTPCYTATTLEAMRAAVDDSGPPKRSSNLRNW